MKRLQPSRPDRSSRRKVGAIERLERATMYQSRSSKQKPRTHFVGTSCKFQHIEASAEKRGSTVHVNWPMVANV